MNEIRLNRLSLRDSLKNNLTNKSPFDMSKVISKTTGVAPTSQANLGSERGFLFFGQKPEMPGIAICRGGSLLNHEIISGFFVTRNLKINRRYFMATDLMNSVTNVIENVSFKIAFLRDVFCDDPPESLKRELYGLGVILNEMEQQLKSAVDQLSSFRDFQGEAHG